jgi:hypothetical protein
MTQIRPGAIGYHSGARNTSAVDQPASLFDSAKCRKGLGVVQSCGGNIGQSIAQAIGRSTKCNQLRCIRRRLQKRCHASSVS